MVCLGPQGASLLREEWMDPLQHFQIGKASRQAGGSLKSSQTSWSLHSLYNQKRDKQPPQCFLKGWQTLHSKAASLPCLTRTQGTQIRKLGVAWIDVFKKLMTKAQPIVNTNPFSIKGAELRHNSALSVSEEADFILYRKHAVW